MAAPRSNVFVSSSSPEALGRAPASAAREAAETAPSGSRGARRAHHAPRRTTATTPAAASATFTRAAGRAGGAAGTVRGLAGTETGSDESRDAICPCVYGSGGARTWSLRKNRMRFTKSFSSR